MKVNEGMRRGRHGGKKEITQDFINNMTDGKMIELDRKALKA